MNRPTVSDHVISVRGIWGGDGTADVRIECGGCDWFADLRYPTALEHITALGNGHRMMMTAVREAVTRAGGHDSP